MKKIMLITGAMVMLTAFAYAQNARFVRSGTIVYKKIVNRYAIIQRGINKGNEALMKPAFEKYQQQHPQFKESNSTLVFEDQKTLFTPIGSNVSISSFFEDPLISMQNNVVYCDLDAKQIVSKRKVFDDTYLLKDSLRAIKWKFTDEVRDVAGYACHRANGLTADSVYVVAFYADQIPVPAGPESFGGLPGMILQLALPHENVSWVATQVTDAPPVQKVSAPQGGTVTDFKGLVQKLRGVFKGRGDGGTKDLIGFLL